MIAIHQSVAETLTVDAMILIDEVETFFGDMDGGIGALPAEAQAGVVQAGLRVSTRMTRLIDWLVRHDARIESPPENFVELSAADLNVPNLPPRARALIDAAYALFARVDGLRDTSRGLVPVESPARLLQMRVARSFGQAG